MRSTLVCLLSVLLFGINLDGLTATALPSPDGESLDGDIPLNIQNGNSRVKIKLMDLNVDVLFLIFGQNTLGIRDYWNIIEINSKFKPIVHSILRSRNTRIEIKNACSGKAETSYFSDHFENRIVLIELDLILKTIENLGAGMRQIYVDNFSIDQFSSSPNSENSNRVFQIINKYASETLECFDLGRLKENTLQQLTEPFPKVEEVALEITENINAGILPLNQLFPSLKKLKLKMMYATGSYSVLDCAFAHLESITFEFDDRAWQRRDQIEAFLRKNTHVKTVAIAFIPREFLKEIPVLLPNIEHLMLNTVFIDDDVVQFDHVKHCTLYNHIMYMYGNTSYLLFPKLESLELVYSNHEHERNVYTKFFEKHSNLKKLDLKRTSDILAVEVASMFPHLVEISLDSSFRIENIHQIIESHKELQRMQLSNYKYEKIQLEIIRQQFGNEWRIHHFANSKHSEAILFEKI